MSALPPKADINPHGLECLLIARSGHSQFRNNHGNVVHRDAGGGAVHSIKSGPLGEGWKSEILRKQDVWKAFFSYSRSNRIEASPSITHAAATTTTEFN